MAPCGAYAPQRIFHSKPLHMCCTFRLFKCPNTFDERVIQLMLTIWYRFSFYKNFTTTSKHTQVQGHDWWWEKKNPTTPKKKKDNPPIQPSIGILINYLSQTEIQVIKMTCILYGAYTTRTILKWILKMNNTSWLMQNIPSPLDNKFSWDENCSSLCTHSSVVSSNGLSEKWLQIS